MSDVAQGPGWWQASDGKWYPPAGQQLPPPPPFGAMGPMPLPPSQGMSGCLKAFLIVGGVATVIGVGSCVALTFAVNDAVDDVQRTRIEAQDDVTGVDCTTDSAGFMSATVSVTNDSPERSNYSIDVTFEGADGSQLETAIAFVSALEPGQRTTAVASTVTDAPAGFTCRAVDVFRFSDELDGP
jgi:hypothetical protein